MARKYQVSFHDEGDLSLLPHFFHDQPELILSMSGEGNFFLDKKVYRLRQGTLLFIAPDALHRRFSAEYHPYERYIITYPLATLREISTPASDLLGLLGGLTLAIDLPTDRFEHTVWLLENCLRQNESDFGGDIRRELFFVELLLYLCDLLLTDKGRTTEYKEDFPRVRQLLSYIDFNLNEDLSLAALAKEFSMNKYYMCHLFKEATGFTLIEYINCCRILQARRLLREGVSVQKAGEQCGFSNNSHFIRTYGKLTGISPGQYARACRKL